MNQVLIYIYNLGIILNYDDECYVKAHYSPQ